MRWWEERALPRLVDLSLRGHETGEWRRRACAPLHGRVLELGFGSGLNVRWYPEAVTEVTAVEPAGLAWELSERRRARSAVPVVRHGLDGQRLDEPDDSYDAVLTTFTLCTIPDAEGALAEARRVLRPGGTLCFLEHGLAPEERLRRWQRRLEPVQRRVAGGCHLTRDVVALAGTQFEVHVDETGYLSGAGSPWTFLTRGTGL